MLEREADRTPPGFELRRMGEGEQALVVYTPQGRGDEAMPAILLFLACAGECGTDGDGGQVGLTAASPSRSWDDPETLAVIMPQKPVLKKEWETYDATVMKILDGTRCRVRTSQRVYLTGLSQGGHGTWVIGATHPDGR